MGEHQRFARSYLESLPAGVTIHVAGRVVYANPALLRLLGVASLDAAVGRSILEFVRPDFHERTLSRVRSMTERQTPADWVEVVFLREDGAQVPVEVAATCVEWDGQPASQVLVVDVSRRSAAERARHESEARYRSLIDNLPIGVLIHADERIVYANRAAGRITGVADGADLVGREVLSLAHPDELPLARERMLRLYSGEGLPPSEPARVLRPDGSVALAEVTSVPVEWEGRPASQVLLVDVTRRRSAETAMRRLEQRIRQAQKNESLEALAGGVAHELNNLLVSMQGNAELALLDAPPGGPLRSRLDGILAAAHGAAALARQMLAYARRDRARVEAVDLSALVREMRGLLAASVSRLATLRFELGTDLPAVTGDRLQLQQVLMNLVTNASEALRDRPGTITITTGLLDAGPDDLASPYLDDDLTAGRYLVLCVEDTGEGMSADVRARAFDPFFSTRFAGRGLGLAATLGIVRAHRGSVQVQSEPGRGARFRVLLPAADDRAWAGREPQAAAVEADPRGSGTILLVDDDEGVRLVAGHMLRRSGFTVLEAADGRSALELAAVPGQGIDCVVLDLAMPEMDGRATMRSLRGLRPALPLVICSGFGEPDIVREPAKGEAGRLRFVQKPFDRRTLVAAVQAAMGRNG